MAQEGVQRVGGLHEIRKRLRCKLKVPKVNDVNHSEGKSPTRFQVPGVNFLVSGVGFQIPSIVFLTPYTIFFYASDS